MSPKFRTKRPKIRGQSYSNYNILEFHCEQIDQDGVHGIISHTSSHNVNSKWSLGTRHQTHHGMAVC